MKSVVVCVAIAAAIATSACASGGGENGVGQKPSPEPTAVVKPVTPRPAPDKASTAAPVPTETVPESKPEDEIVSVRDVDFGNRSYDVDCLRQVEANLQDGEWQAVPGKPEEGTVTLVDTLYTDVTGNGEDDALVAIHCGVGASTTVPNVFAFKLKANGRVKQLNEERIYGYDPQAADSGFQVSVGVYDEGDPRCCPTFRETQIWAYEDGSLSLVRSSTNRFDAPDGAELSPPTLTVECPLIGSIVYGTTERVSFVPLVNPGSAPITTWAMDYGDGGSYESDSIEDANENLYWHDYSEPGQYPAVLRVIDSNGLSAEASCEVKLVYAEGASIYDSQPPAQERNPWDDYRFVEYLGRDYACQPDFIHHDGYYCVALREGMNPPYISRNTVQLYCRISIMIWPGGAECSPHEYPDPFG